MDFRIFELVSSPFRESYRQAVEGRAVEDEGIYPAYHRLITIGAELAEVHFPDKLGGLYSPLLSAIVKSRNRLVNTQPPSRIPPLYMSAVDVFGSRLTSLPADDLRRVAVALFCAIYFECSEEQLIGINFASSNSNAALYAELASYGGWKAFSDVRNTSDINLNKAIAQAEERLHSVIGSGQLHIQEMIDRNGSLQKQDAVLRSQVQETIAGVKADVAKLAEGASATEVVFREVLKQSKENEDRISISQENIKRYADAVREELQIDSTKKLWKTRARWSTVSFWVSTLVIFFAFAAPIIAASMNIDGIIEVLRHIGDAATQGLPPDATTAQLTTATISRLVIITVPLVIYFWAIKLLVRFNARSMVLMDDARQRETMMDVYFHLVERSGATPEERALVLNALFRPAPGHGPENVEPPNFTDLLGKVAAVKPH